MNIWEEEHSDKSWGQPLLRSRTWLKLREELYATVVRDVHRLSGGRELSTHYPKCDRELGSSKQWAPALRTHMVHSWSI